jgi:DNA-binding CsgD family transcriptional regulator
MSIITHQFRKLFGDSGPELSPSTSPLFAETPASKFNAAFFLDLISHRYTHMDDSCKDLVGYSSKYLIDGGVDSWVDMWSPVQVDIYCNKLLPVIGKYLAEIDPKRAQNYVFTTSYSVRSQQGDIRIILERVVYLYHPMSPSPVAIAGFGSDITHFAEADKTIQTLEDWSRQGESRLIFKNVLFHHSEKAALSKKELEILKWITDGYSSKQVADKLKISRHTVNNHRKNMLEKTGCSNSLELVKYAIAKGLL